jgi:hypothetical protein
VATLAETFVRLGGRPQDVGRTADSHSVAALAEPLRSRIYTVIQDAPGHGLSVSSGYRTPWQQYMLRAERVGAARAFDRNYPGYPRTAIPYSSEHQKGKAADMGGTALQWLIDHEREYGLERTVRGERWHFEATRTPTRRIIPYPGSRPGEPVEPKEPFTVAQYETIMKELGEIREALSRIGARQKEQGEDWLAPTRKDVRELHEDLHEDGTIDKDRLEPTTRRGRETREMVGEIHDHLLGG